MLSLKSIAFTALFLPSLVLAAPTQHCKATFHNFIVDREPGGYPVNKAALTAVNAKSCTIKNTGDKEILLRNTKINIYDKVTHKQQKAISTTAITIDTKRQMANIFNNYLGLDIELPFIKKANQIIIKVNKPPVQVFGQGAAPYYHLKKGAELIIQLPSNYK